MIPAETPTCQPPTPAWQKEMAEAIVSPKALIQALALDPAWLAPAEAAAAKFPLRVPLGYLARMERGNPLDPLLRQVLPLGEELQEARGYVPDPLGEREALRAPGLLHKYHGRALLITTEACGIHCRFCFRREFPYQEQTGAGPRWSAALRELEQDPSIEELILSGGDPLALSDARLASLTSSLASIPHIKRLRVHTRQPVVLPSRVDAGLIAWLESLRWPVVFVLHANHPNEIDPEVQRACARLRASGVTLLNQSVLLPGVNDDAQVLAQLSRKLFDAGVLPYYLHLLDPVRGIAHFDIDEERARKIHGELSATLSGYLVPRLVRESQGAPAKLNLPPRFN